ncbi:MAG: hypothetical protein H7178_08005 [Chitinophagaceae bacterium]|nr:hypothetical protein [Chitinophagaceae bacterium]
MKFEKNKVSGCINKEHSDNFQKKIQNLYDKKYSLYLSKKIDLAKIDKVSNEIRALLKSLESEMNYTEFKKLIAQTK